MVPTQDEVGQMGAELVVVVIMEALDVQRGNDPPGHFLIRSTFVSLYSILSSQSTRSKMCLKTLISRLRFVSWTPLSIAQQGHAKHESEMGVSTVCSQ